MPGVPSGRACDGCRKQKKKCNEAQPSCSRCARLNILCVGSGQQRYKFKEERASPSSSNTSQVANISASQSEASPVPAVRWSLSNDITHLISSFTYSINVSTDVKYNLAWSYGLFLEEIPQRLGTNEALDASVKALTSAHSIFCSRRQVTPDALAKYSRALRILRLCLDDPVKARTSETLCAVMLLLISQGILGAYEGRWSGHGEGAAQIIKARGYHHFSDAFENKLLLSLRGPVLFEGIFNKNIRFTPSEWQMLVENDLDGATYEGQMMRSLARLPDLMQRGKYIYRGDKGYPELLEELKKLYRGMKAIIGELYARLAVIQGVIDEGALQTLLVVHTHAHYQRSYGLALAIGISLGCVLSVVDADDLELIAELEHFAREILIIAERAAIYRPLGASYVVLCLSAAWAATSDRTIRSTVEKFLVDYQCDAIHQRGTMSIGELEQFTGQLHLLDPDIC